MQCAYGAGEIALINRNQSERKPIITETFIYVSCEKRIIDIGVGWHE